MSLRNRSRKMPQVNIDGARLQDAQELVSKSARQAAERVGPTTRQARKIAAKQMKSARYWSAPRIDQAGQYIEDEVGPRVGAMLHRTAGRVEPDSTASASWFRRDAARSSAAPSARPVRSRHAATPRGRPRSDSSDLSAVSENSGTERAHSNN